MLKNRFDPQAFLQEQPAPEPKQPAGDPVPLIPSSDGSRFGAPGRLADWWEWVGERAAHLEYGCEISRPEASQLAYSEAVEAWCSRFWVPPSPNTCAACHRPAPGFLCGDGASVCRVADHSCLIDYGTIRKKTAVRALAVVRVVAPAGWVLPDGSKP